jgi:hypothetical protein
MDNIKKTIFLLGYVMTNMPIYLKCIILFNSLNFIYAQEKYLNYANIQFWAFILFIILISYGFQIRTWVGCKYRKNFYRIGLPFSSFISVLLLGKGGFAPANELPIIYTLLVTFILHLGLKDTAEKWIQNKRSII